MRRASSSDMLVGARWARTALGHAAHVLSRDQKSSAVAPPAPNDQWRYPIMVRIEEVQDETEKLRQQGFSAPQEDDQDWEATDDESDDVCTSPQLTAGGPVRRRRVCVGARSRRSQRDAL